MFRLLTVLLLSYITLSATVKPLHVEVNIYKNISFTTKEYQLSGDKNISLHVPLSTKLEEIDIETNRCKKGLFKFLPAKPFESIEKKNLERKISNLSNQIAGLKEEGRLLKTLSLEQKSQKSAREILSFFTKNYISNLKQITLLEEKLKKAKEKLKDLEEHHKSNHKILSTRFTCRGSGKVSIKYPQYDFKVSSFYEIKGDVKNGTIAFVKKIKIMQQSDENFRNIDIISHSNSYNRRVKPSPFFPKYLNIRQKKRLLYSKKSTSAISLDAMVQPIAKVEYIQNLTTSAFVVRGVNLPSFQDKIITLENKTYRALFQNDIDGYGSAVAYLKASYTSDKYYQRGKAYIVLGDNRIGSINIKDIKKDKKVEIYFGENQNIDVKKTLLRRYNESEFFGNNQINTQIWRYTIKNLHNSTQKVNLIERIPISQNEDIKVEPLFDAKKAKIDKKGRVIWSFKLKQNEIKIVKFGYKTTRPKR